MLTYESVNGIYGVIGWFSEWGGKIGYLMNKLQRKPKKLLLS